MITFNYFKTLFRTAEKLQYKIQTITCSMQLHTQDREVGWECCQWTFYPTKRNVYDKIKREHFSKLSKSSCFNVFCWNSTKDAGILISKIVLRFDFLFVCKLYPYLFYLNSLFPINITLFFLWTLRRKNIFVIPFQKFRVLSN